MDATFVGPCKHAFHVQCAEANFVVGGKTCCPLCRIEFLHAPGFVALARAEAAARRAAAAVGEGPSEAAAAAAARAAPAAAATHFNLSSPQRRDALRWPGAGAVEPAVVMPDVPPPSDATVVGAGAEAPEAFVLTPDFATAKVVMDVKTVAPGETQRVTALVTVQFADDSDAAPVAAATDFVLLADVSGSMSGAKISAVREALLLLSDMFGPRDRVSLVAFDNQAVQLTPLAPLSADPQAEAAFRRAAMTIFDGRGGGTDIGAAMTLALQILDSRGSCNPLSHVLLLTDGQDDSVRGEARLRRLVASPASAPVWSSLGFGADHDAETLAALAARGGGTFTYQEGTALLAETLAAYIGNSTHVLAAGAVLRIEPAPGVGLVSVKGPGEGGIGADGAAQLALGFARVADTREVLLVMDVTVPVDAPTAHVPLLSVTVSGHSATTRGAAAVVTPALAVAFGSGLTRSLASELELADANEAIARAANRETLALASAAVAATPQMLENLALGGGGGGDGTMRSLGSPRRVSGHRRRSVGVEGAEGPLDTAVVTASIIAAAKSTLRGSPAVRRPAEAELEVLEAQMADSSRLMASAHATAHRSRHQATLMMSPGGSFTPSKGATTTASRMSSKIAAGAGA